MKNESLDDFIIHPARGRNEKAIPPVGIFFVNPSEARMGIDLLLAQGGKKRFLFHSGLVISPGNDFFVAGPAVGAPMAVMTLEKLIALGASSVIMSGWCGALDKKLAVGDSLLGGMAHCGEGTSRYYSPDAFCQPSPLLVQKLQSIVGKGIASLPIWSTDAPYRESRTMFDALVEKYGIGGVDMEYSALCTVASCREVNFAALFLVSDELWNREWKAGFSSKIFKQKSKTLVVRLIEQVQALVKEEEL